MSDATFSSDSSLVNAITPNETSRWDAVGRICEVLAAAAFGVAGIFVLARLTSVDGKTSTAAIVLAVVSGLIVWILGLGFLSRAGQRTLSVQQHRRYTVNWPRLRTLSEVGLPEDALGCLRQVNRNAELTEEELLGPLRTQLGAIRAGEVQNLILKYTMIDPS